MTTTPCPHCGQPINPAQLLGKMTSERKKKASAENGRNYWIKKKENEQSTKIKQSNRASAGD